MNDGERCADEFLAGVSVSPRLRLRLSPHGWLVLSGAAVEAGIWHQSFFALLTLLREVTLASSAALNPTGWLCFFRKSAKAALASS
jgi:hypothetical protein